MERIGKIGTKRGNSRFHSNFPDSCHRPNFAVSPCMNAVVAVIVLGGPNYHHQPLLLEVVLLPSTIMIGSRNNLVASKLFQYPSANNLAERGKLTPSTIIIGGQLNQAPLNYFEIISMGQYLF